MVAAVAQAPLCLLGEVEGLKLSTVISGKLLLWMKTKFYVEGEFFQTFFFHFSEINLNFEIEEVFQWLHLTVDRLCLLVSMAIDNFELR